MDEAVRRGGRKAGLSDRPNACINLIPWRDDCATIGRNGANSPASAIGVLVEGVSLSGVVAGRTASDTTLDFSRALNAITRLLKHGGQRSAARRPLLPCSDRRHDASVGGRGGGRRVVEPAGGLLLPVRCETIGTLRDLCTRAGAIAGRA